MWNIIAAMPTPTKRVVATGWATIHRQLRKALEWLKNVQNVQRVTKSNQAGFGCA